MGEIGRDEIGRGGTGKGGTSDQAPTREMTVPQDMDATQEMTVTVVGADPSATVCEGPLTLLTEQGWRIVAPAEAWRDQFEYLRTGQHLRARIHIDTRTVEALWHAG